ncbi:MAG: histidine kinase [Bacteroidota bacterium]|nr:histidine kinase [Bacteroidota bacterium]
MKFFRTWFFPPLYGLMVYFTLRLLADSASGARFWERSRVLNFAEIGCSMIMGYLVIRVFDRLFRWFDARWQFEISYRRIARELGYLFIVNQVIQNLVLTPFAALTDNGLQWADVIDINTIPLLYALIYYGILRSNHFLQSYIASRIQLEKIMNDQLQTELKFLRAQYHPHFLFNALNAIYFQIDKDVEGAKDTVEKFSQLLRYQLYDQHQAVTIGREIEYLENFIALARIRTSTKLQLDVFFDTRLNGERVYPLLFQPLVENGFKYIGGDYLLKISLEKQEKGIYFRVENSVPGPVHFKKNKGIGLENLKRRLELLYPGKHLLKTTIQHDSFLAELTLITG